MVVTGHPSILGNMPPGRENAPEYEKIAFIGQIPVNVVGPVEAGDYIIPSQDGDGFGVAVRTSDLGLAGLEHIVGRAWESNPDPGRKKVLIEVGLDHSAATASLFRKQQAEIDSLREIVQKLVAALGTD